MGKRAEQKEASLLRILDVASRRLREQGVDGAGIASVMKEAGLTHGAFYSHFGNKDELAGAAFRHAIATT
ncbi:MAG: TetR family transcriptional regulator, partial [Pseudomonadales bacterium]|nr:TetR family transcriptional regulator [Pseudomonadales bacterium]